ncbi:hypothetical protein [Ekhidna sp.]
MQIKNNHSNYLQKPWIIGLVKMFLLVGCLFFLLTKLQDQSISFDETKIPEGIELTLTLVFGLMLINWFLESLRWKISIEIFETISIIDAWKAVLGGLALNWVLPLTSGDLLTRISQQQDKYQATSAVVLNRGIMLTFTLLLGVYGINCLAVEYDWNWWMVMVIPIILSVGFLFRKSFIRFTTYFIQMQRKVLIQIIGLSFLRYTVFVLQFFLLLKLFLPALSANLLIAGIGWIFLIRSILPLFLGGLGIREASGILFFQPYVSELQLAIIPIFLIWIINTVIPSFIGLIFLWRFKPSLAG